ncbi:hypothetical protein [Streptomyces sp. NPDC021470]|uniref:hypothetical protein n=1 Tax=Streptomyces sp. NPDC021470 TaxID=3154902 RepID=UPI0033D38B58
MNAVAWSGTPGSGAERDGGQPGACNAFVIVERTYDESGKGWYMQVWLKHDYTYQLEFQDGSAAERYQTRTISQEKVIDALRGWAESRQGGKDTFMWNNIGDWFANAD